MQRTTEDLREILFNTLDDVRSGKIDHQQARAVGDLAGRIVDTAELELSYANTLERLDGGVSGVSPGRLLLTQASEPGIQSDTSE